MTPAHRRYLLIETALSAGINAVLSIVFVVLLFGGETAIAAPALVRDSVPQSFAIALMGTLVPTLLTLRRLRAGVIAPLPGVRVPRSRPVVRALVTAVAIAAVAGAVHWAVLPRLLDGPVAFGTVLVAKAVYGALLGAAATLVALGRVLAEER